MTQRFRVLTVLLEDPSSAPRTNFRQFITICNPLQGLQNLLTSAGTCIHVHRPTHRHTTKTIFFFFKKMTKIETGLMNTNYIEDNGARNRPQWSPSSIPSNVTHSFTIGKRMRTKTREDKHITIW